MKRKYLCENTSHTLFLYHYLFSSYCVFSLPIAKNCTVFYFFKEVGTLFPFAFFYYYYLLVTVCVETKRKKKQKKWIRSYWCWSYCSLPLSSSCSRFLRATTSTSFVVIDGCTGVRVRSGTDGYCVIEKRSRICGGDSDFEMWCGCCSGKDWSRKGFPLDANYRVPTRSRCMCAVISREKIPPSRTRCRKRCRKSWMNAWIQKCCRCCGRH